MKILVIDDRDINQDSAATTLGGHEVTIIGSYDEAISVLVPECGYEVVLSDLMMPMSKETIIPGVYKNGELVPYGFILALRASAAGAKYVAVVTDTNHHNSAVSAAIDHAGGFKENGDEAWNCGWEDGAIAPRFTINGAKAFFIHAPVTQDGAKDWGKVFSALTR